MKARLGPQMANRLIWREHTDGFPDFVAEVESAKAGNRFIRESLEWLGSVANERMESLLNQAEGITEQHKLMLSGLTQPDINTIRGRQSSSPGLLIRLVSISFSIAESFRKELDAPLIKLDDKGFANNFLFRVGVALTCSFLEWIKTGSQHLVKPAKIRNDHVDAMMSVFGTYFNGVMTGDKKFDMIHSVNRHLLRSMGATIPPVYQNL